MTEALRGRVFRLDLHRGAGAPSRKTLPCLIVQNDIANRHAPHTIVAAIREDVGKDLPVQVAVPKGVAGMRKDSVVDCGFLATVDKSLLGECLGEMPGEIMALVDEALQRSLQLNRRHPDG